MILRLIREVWDEDKVIKDLYLNLSWILKIFHIESDFVVIPLVGESLYILLFSTGFPQHPPLLKNNMFKPLLLPFSLSYQLNWFFFLRIIYFLIFINFLIGIYTLTATSIKSALTKGSKLHKSKVYFKVLISLLYSNWCTPLPFSKLSTALASVILLPNLVFFMLLQLSDFVSLCAYFLLSLNHWFCLWPKAVSPLHGKYYIFSGF